MLDKKKTEKGLFSKILSTGVILILLLVLMAALLDSDPGTTNSGTILSSTTSTKEETVIDILLKHGWDYHYLGESYAEGKPRYFSKDGFSINLDPWLTFQYASIDDKSSDYEKIIMKDRGSVILYYYHYSKGYATSFNWFPENEPETIYFETSYAAPDGKNYDYIASYNMNTSKYRVLLTENKQFERVIDKDSISIRCVEFHEVITKQLSSLELTIDQLIHEAKSNE